MAVWSQRWFIVVPLVAIIIAHWSLLLHGRSTLLLSHITEFKFARVILRCSVDRDMGTIGRMCDNLHR